MKSYASSFNSPHVCGGCLERVVFIIFIAVQLSLSAPQLYIIFSRDASLLLVVCVYLCYCAKVGTNEAVKTASKVSSAFWHTDTHNGNEDLESEKGA